MKASSRPRNSFIIDFQSYHRYLFNHWPPPEYEPSIFRQIELRPARIICPLTMPMSLLANPPKLATKADPLNGPARSIPQLTDDQVRRAEKRGRKHTLSNALQSKHWYPSLIPFTVILIDSLTNLLQWPYLTPFNLSPSPTLDIHWLLAMRRGEWRQENVNIVVNFLLYVQEKS